jgi:predicted  nucleic acid-binding Zn-ribbon protein
MLRVALAILVLAPALLQDDGKKQDPNRREREILARIQKIEGQIKKSENEEERARLTKDLDNARAELEQVRAGAMKDVEKKGRIDVEELRRRVAELQGHIRDLRDKMERTDDPKTRDSIANDCRKCEGELERVQNQLRAVEKKGPPEDRESPRELQALANQLREKLSGLDKSAPEFKEVYARLQEVEARLREMGGKRLPPDKEPMPPPPGRDGRDVDMERALQFAREFEPGTHRKLEQLIREKRHDDAMRLARDVMPRIQQMEELKATNPDGFRRQQDIASAERDAWALSDKLRKSEGDDRARMREELLKSLGRLFEMRESARAKELEELEKRVAELKSMLRKRQENKDKIIEKRAQEMVGEEFEW